MKRREFLVCLGAAAAQGAPVALVGPNEPGPRIRVSGTILSPDGKPARNVRLFLYHTDAAGYYSRTLNNPRESRIRGSVQTDAQGRYEINTIMPARYAEVRDQPPAHIHVHVAGDGVPEHWIESFMFAGDPRLAARQVEAAREMGAFSPIMTARPGGGSVTLYRRDIRLNRELFERNALVNGWYRS